MKSTPFSKNLVSPHLKSLAWDRKKHHKTSTPIICICLHNAKDIKLSWVSSFAYKVWYSWVNSRRSIFLMNPKFLWRDFLNEYFNQKTNKRCFSGHCCRQHDHYSWGDCHRPKSLWPYRRQSDEGTIVKVLFQFPSR